MSLNKVQLIGNVGKDPDVRYLDNGVAVATFSLATTDRAYTLANGTQVPERTEWHNIVLWRGLAQTAEKYVRKGALSSFLDNTPTYLVFLTTAGAMHFTTGVATTLGVVPVKMLMAISCGAVFMGANTYIGNAPNFMVKSLSDENGINMPSFFGYIWWSLRYLIPVFIIDMIIFFL